VPSIEDSVAAAQPAAEMSSLECAEEAVRLLKGSTLTAPVEASLAVQLHSLLRIVKQTIKTSQVGETSGDS
jgi:hypothetical protein